MQVNYGETEIKSLLSKVRIFNSGLGAYKVHAITNEFNYAVKLSNGKILFKLEDLQDDERDALTKERLTALAGSFIPDVVEENKQFEKDSPSYSHSTTEIPKSKGSSRKLVFTLLIVVVVIGIVAALISNETNSYSGDSYQEKVMTVEEIEKSAPTNFLSADGTYRENFWGDKLKVSCVLTNKATVATYKDAIVRVTYYSKTKTELGTKDYTIYEMFPPHSERTIELKIENFKNVHSIGWEVISAIAL